MNPSDRISLVMRAFREWISPENRVLAEAVDRTLDARLFGYSDIEHQLKALNRGCTEAILHRWIVASADEGDDRHERAPAQQVLCLHAGNLPLAGFQDVVAVLLSGCAYIGKHSRRDPWLLAGFLDILQDMGAKVETHSTTLEGLAATGTPPADALLFSGSARSVPIVTQELLSHGLMHPDSKLLIRRSSLSVFHDVDGALGSSDAVMEELVRAMMLHDGRGCRSVGVVVTPVSLNDVQCALTDAAEQFLLRHRGLPLASQPFLHELAYERASGRTALWLDRLLVIEREGLPNRPGIVHWQQGGSKELDALLETHAESIQTLYRMEHSSGGRTPAGSTPAGRTPAGSAASTFNAAGRIIEPLGNAQSPDIDWRPDGIDPIRWLRRR